MRYLPLLALLLLAGCYAERQQPISAVDHTGGVKPGGPIAVWAHPSDHWFDWSAIELAATASERGLMRAGGATGTRIDARDSARLPTTIAAAKAAGAWALLEVTVDWSPNRGERNDYPYAVPTSRFTLAGTLHEVATGRIAWSGQVSFVSTDAIPGVTPHAERLAGAAIAP